MKNSIPISSEAMSKIMNQTSVIYHIANYKSNQDINVINLYAKFCRSCTVSVTKWLQVFWSCDPQIDQRLNKTM